MKNGFEIVTTPLPDGKILQDTYSISVGVKEQIMRRIMDTKESQVREALIELGWTPPAGRIDTQ